MNIISKSTLFILLSSIFLTAVAGGENPFEVKIASAQTSQNGFIRLRTKFYMERHKKDERAQQLLDFSKDCKNEEISAKSSVIVINYYMKQKKWNELLALSQVFFDKYPNMIALRTKVKVYLFRIISNKKIDLSIRKKAFEILSKKIKNCGSYLGFTRHFVQTAYPDKEERYKIFSDLAFDAGPSFYSANFLLGFLQRIAWGNKNHQNIINKCNKFIEFYGKDSADSKEVFKIKLKHQSALNDKEAKEELKKIKQQDKNKLAEIDKIISTIKKQINNKNYAKSIDDIQKLNPYSLSLINKRWRQLESEINKTPAGEKLLFALALSKVLPASKNIDRLFSSITRDPNIFAPKHANNYLNFMDNVFTKERNADAIIAYQRGHFLPLFLGRKISNHNLKLKLYGILSNYCLKANIKDMAAELLYKKSKLEFDINKKQTVTDLTKITKIFPNSGIAHKAAWLLSIISGESTILQGPLPRSETFFQSAIPDFKFSYKSNAKPDNNYLKNNKGSYSLKENNSLENVIDNKIIEASSAQQKASSASDKNLKTIWTPQSSPSGILFPLKKISSLHKIVIKTEGKIWFYIDLLDKNKKIIRRYERAWGVWENLNKETYWPKENIKLSFIPVANIAFIKLVLFDRSRKNGGIKEIQAFESKYPAQCSETIKTGAIPANSKSMQINWKANEPEFTTKYTPDMESVRGFPLMRWFNPWKRKKSPLYIRTVGNNLGIKFIGKNAVLELQRQGALTWNVDFLVPHSISKNSDKEDNQIKIKTAKEGNHILSLNLWALPAHNDIFGQKNIVFNKLIVKDKSVATLLIRFKRKNSSKWSVWKTLSTSENKAFQINKYRGGKYQLSVAMNTEASLANSSPTVSDIDIKFSSNKKGKNLTNYFLSPEISFINNNIDAVKKQLAMRNIVVTYPKTGTKEEYDIAKKIAQKAGVYLVPDDIGLNNYPGPVLAIGTPLRNRYCRQLLSRYFVWDDTAFLNNKNGYAGVAKNAKGNIDFYYITANTPKGVINAATRVLKTIESYTPAKAPFRLFNASTIERIYPWQLHTQRKLSPPLQLEMAVNDRRSVQLGINFNHQMNTLTANCSNLTNDAGNKLPTAEVRFMGFCEYFQFFGNLRLPDILVEEPKFPIPSNTSTGIWVTVKTPKGTPAGKYKGTITVAGNDFKKRVPITVNVLPFNLPPINRMGTASYSSLPFWYHLGTEESKETFRRLCQNEVEHSLSMVTVGVMPTYKITKNKNNNYQFTFNFKNLDWQLKIADEVYKKANAPLPGFFAMPRLKLKSILGSIPRKERKAVNIEYQFAVQLSKYLKKRGCFKRFYLKVGDELRSMKLWISLAKEFKRGGLQLTTTTNSPRDNYDAKSKAIGLLDAYCPNYQHNVLEKFYQERKKSKDKVWWYSCGTPQNRITGKTVDNLPLYWLTAKWNFDGAHSYGGLSIPESGVEGNDLPFRYDHGLAYRIMVLPDGSIIDTIRRELASEGMKDCLLIYAIKDKIKKLKNSGNSKKAKYYNSKLESILESVVPYKYGYAKTPEEWEKARKKLYATAVNILKIKR